MCCVYRISGWENSRYHTYGAYATVFVENRGEPMDSDNRLYFETCCGCFEACSS